jgi:hypothetical protein
MATDITAITSSNIDDTGVGIRHSFQGLFSEIRPFELDILDASLPAQTASEVDVTVAGAALGDFVFLSGAAVDTAGLLISGYVSAANTVTIIAFNVEGTDANTTLATTA